MIKLVYAVISSITIYTVYGLFGEQINNGIVYITTRINNLSCYAPKQAVRLGIYLFILILIKLILIYINN